jgi:hypothetical protein
MQEQNFQEQVLKQRHWHLQEDLMLEQREEQQPQKNGTSVSIRTARLPGRAAGIWVQLQVIVFQLELKHQH